MWHHRPGPHVHAIGPQAQAGSRLFRYIVATSWAHQLSLVALTTAVFLLEIVPLELQRRIINDLEKHRLYVPILLLCAAYATAVLVQGTTKLGLNIYRSWVGERAKRELRRRIIALKTVTAGSRSVADAQGTAISMVIAEVEPIGGFIGESVSEPLLQTGILVAIIAYIVHLDAWMGAAAIALFVPQLIFVPLLQNGMNRRTSARVWLLRQIGAAVISGGRTDENSSPADSACSDRVFRLSMGIFKRKFTMNFLMSLCTHMQIVAALLLGGWWVLHEQMEIGAIVAFISGVGRLTDPWGDLVNYLRELSVTRIKFGPPCDGHKSGNAVEH